MLSVFYCPPEPDELLVTFQEFLQRYSSTKLSNVVLLGDFNFPQIDWTYGLQIYIFIFLLAFIQYKYKKI